MSDTVSPTGSEPAKGLPPVVPPSGRFIAQLFVVPGVIVAAVVAVLLWFSWLAGGSRTPDAFLRDLDSTNPEVRWRAASDLAQVLKRDEQLASDPQFGLYLAGLLHRSLQNSKTLSVAQPEKNAPEKTTSDLNQARMQRSNIQYLAACLGNLTTPVGAPVLCDMAKSDYGGDEKTKALIRRQAIWALANLGDNASKLKKKPQKCQEAMDDICRAIADRSPADSEVEWARKAHTYLGNLYLRDADRLGVIETLAECAKSDDPFVRKQVALALSFWEGDPAENELAEKALLRLTRDDGRGTAVEIGERD